jgi:hypothetical protein
MKGGEKARKKVEKRVEEVCNTKNGWEKNDGEQKKKKAERSYI